MAPEKLNTTNVNQLRNASNILPSTSALHSPYTPPFTQMTNPPPLPPRQPGQSYSGYNDYRPFGNNYYGSYGYGNHYRGYGGYGSFSNYMPYSGMSGYNNYGHSGDVESRFTQYAEESTRSTFRIIETVLQTFSSLTMMIESTYFAMTTSFRAILSVAENIGRLRSTIGQLLSTLTLIRMLKWMYRKIMYHIGLQNRGVMEDDLWQRSAAQVANDVRENANSWSSFFAFSMFIVIPYLIHKITSNAKQLQVKEPDPKEWHNCDDPVYAATALYDFTGASADELSIKAGQKIYIAPQSMQSKNNSGWLKATDNVKVGLVPYNYIKVVGQLQKKPQVINTPTSAFAPDDQKSRPADLNNSEKNVPNLQHSQEPIKEQDCRQES